LSCHVTRKYVELSESISVTGVAIIGVGSAGQRHLKVLSEIKNVDPIAVPKRESRVSELKQSGYRAAVHLKSAIEMGASLCLVASDTGDHFQDGLDAMEAGLDVLVEKPLARDAAEARRLQECSLDLGRKLFVGCGLRFSESLNWFKNSLPKIGRLHSVSIETQSYLPDWRPQRPYRDSYSARRDEGGVLRDLIHEIDYAVWIFGRPDSIQARLRNLGRLEIESEETADLNWETPEGCAVVVRLDYLSTPSRRRLRAYGDLGTIEWDGVRKSVTLMMDDGTVGEMESHQTRDQMFRAQAQAFVNSSIHTHPNLATGLSGVDALAICDAARLASENRREERVNYS